MIDKDIFAFGLLDNAPVYSAPNNNNPIKQTQIIYSDLNIYLGLTNISFIELLYCLIIIVVMIVIDELLKPVLSKKFQD